MCVCVCIYMYVYTYIYIHIHTYIYIYISVPDAGRCVRTLQTWIGYRILQLCMYAECRRSCMCVCNS